MSLEPGLHLGLHKLFSCKLLKKEHTSARPFQGYKGIPAKSSQGPLCTNLVMISCKHPLGRISENRTSHQGCHCHGTKVLLLEIHLLGTKTPLGPTQAFLFQALKRKNRGAASRDPCLWNPDFPWTSATSSLIKFLTSWKKEEPRRCF